ncbi:toll/interleukin-1 receptor domain-containing protein [Priestia flexa]|uniref:toll/interleukin-1 receptor domain-containing protein n=1 Tax=Priestia flexa TaxID=86664 RepID=UPI0011A833BE|nr:toll/interleukin-1 receptor domain-containing protein [Priestia flexa]
MNRKQVFISYSWDSKEHQEWVLSLANSLREKGLIAETDIFETQSNSVHLNKMMVDKVRDSDFLIIVLTENYAKKADNFEGGVGFESLLTLPLIMENPDKLILTMRHQGDFNKVFPFHFKGHYALDFSADSQFDSKFQELLHRLYKMPLYYVAPIGEVPELTPKIPSRQTQQSLNNVNEVTTTSSMNFADLDLSIPKIITDKDINIFLKQSFKDIVEGFNLLFKHIQSINPQFDFDREDINTYKTVFILYINGQNVSGIKIWYGNSVGGNMINCSYGRVISSSDNSMNEMITYDIDEKQNLKLKMTMNIFGHNMASTPEEVVKEIWKNNISPTIQ